MQSQQQKTSLGQGIYAFNKPKGITSYDVLRIIKRSHKGEKIGHGGTLDPLASGVLVVAIGRQFTKQLGNILHKTKKTYNATICLGAVSETDDSEGPLHEVAVVNIPTSLAVSSVIKTFVGPIKQTPPVYSAIKIGGVASYKRARRGETIQIQEKEVTVYGIRLIEYKYPYLKLEIECGSGVYVRSIARDIGNKLGCGGYLSGLERTKVGDFSILSCYNL